MARIKKYALIFFACSALTRSFADGSLIPFGEIGKISFADADTAVRFETKNDSLGFLSRTDWDDLRTFGLYFGFSSRKWALEITADALTDRATETGKSGRIDELYGSLSRQLLCFSAEPYSASIAAGAGILDLGRFGMYEMQKLFHASYKNKRPIPDAYDNPEQRQIFMTEGIFTAHRDSPVIPFNFFSSLEIGHTGFFRTVTYLDATALDGFLGADVFGGFRWASNYGDQGATFGKTLDEENGFQIGSAFHAGFLETGYSYNLVTTRQCAYLAASFGGGNERRNSKADTEHVQELEFGMMPFLGVIRIRKSVARAPLVISPVLGADSNSMKPNGVSVAETELYQFEQVYAGIDLAKPVQSWVDGYVMGAGGVRYEQHRTRTVHASQILEDRTGFVAMAEGGARFFLPQKDTTAGEWGVCLAGGIAYAHALEPGFYPYLHITLIGATGRR